MSEIQLRKNRWILLTAAMASIPSTASAAFPSPIQANPAAEYTAAVGVNHNAVQTFNRTLYLDLNNPTVEYPNVYWFKYTSDGQSVVKFDTLGSDFGTNGPGNVSGGGAVLGTYNQSQVAVYHANGQLVGIAKGSQSPAGDPNTLYPGYSRDSCVWYYGQGLTESYFQPNAPGNPHWSASPSDPTPFTAWAAPGNEGNSQKYYPNYYPTSLNEYQVWNTALGTIMLDSSGQPVINPNTGQPRSQPGWRYYDRARCGPGTPWNRYGALPAGDYYIAVSSSLPTFQGDASVEEVLRAPVHFDYSTFLNYQSQLTGPMGTFQYYVGQRPTYQFGNIRLNVSTLPVGVNNNSQWIANASGSFSDPTKWSAGVPNGVDSTARLLSGISSLGTISLSQITILGSLQINNANRYTISGTDYLGFFSSGGVSSISVQAGSHVVDAPVHFYNAVNADVASGAELTIAQPVKYFTAVSLNKTGGGTLVLAGGGGSASLDMPVYALLNVTGGTLVAGGAHQFGSISLAGGTKLKKTGYTPLTTSVLNINSLAQLDMNQGGVVVDYTGATSPLGTILPLMLSGRASGSWSGNGINSSAAAVNPITGVGYTDTAITGSTTFFSESVDSTAVLLRYTLLGDANVDGTVSSVDFDAFIGNYGSLTGSRWYQGDFDYNGKVNTLDFNYLAGNFGSSLAPAPTLGSLTPEPAAGMLGIALLSLAVRRSRNRVQ